MSRGCAVGLIAGLVVVVCNGSARAEPAIEFEGLLLGGTLGGFAGGVGGLIGLPLGERWVLMSGLGATFWSSEAEGGGGRGWTEQVSVPVLLKCYLREPATGVVLPFVRLGGAYTYLEHATDDWEVASHGGQASGALGLHVLLNEHLGLGGELGATYGRTTQHFDGEAERSWHLSVDWRVGLLVRL